jgi:hypothetical protein
MSEKKTVDEQIKEVLKLRKPNLTDSSIKSYISTLKSIYWKVYPKDEFDLKKFNNTKKFLDFMKEYPEGKRKTILAGLVNVCDEDKCDDYRKVMMSDSLKYSTIQKTQKKNEKQEAGWVEDEELKKLMDEQEFVFNEIMKIKNPTMEQLQKAQSYIILCLTTGKFIPPRRSIDWIMKHKNYDEENDNYYDKKQFVFNKYKTKKYHGQTKINCPPELKKILNKWISKIDNEYLLFDNSNGPLSAVTLTQRLNKIFGKKTSINILRHMFLSKKYENVPALQEMLKTADQMGHDLTTALEYVKK